MSKRKSFFESNEAPAEVPPEVEAEFAEQAGLPINKWWEVENADCPTCGFKYAGCHNEHSTVMLGVQVILNGIKLGPGETIVPTEASALWLPALVKE